jgi:hypothetical protein
MTVTASPARSLSRDQPMRRTIEMGLAFSSHSIRRPLSAEGALGCTRPSQASIEHKKIHEACDIIAAMKNVTISLDEKTAAWARRHAAERNSSLSRFIGELLEQSMRQSREYERAMRQYFSRGPVRLKKRGSAYPSRDDLHDRAGLR